MSKFSKGMADATARIVSNSKREIRKVIRGIAKDTIMGTPVDKGTLINNWYASNRAIPNQTTKATDPSGKTSLSRVDKALTRLKIGQTFYMPIAFLTHGLLSTASIQIRPRIQQARPSMDSLGKLLPVWLELP